MYTDVVTLFCKRGKVWYPTVLAGVELNMDRGSIIKQYGADSSDNAKLHVKYVVVDDKKMVSGKQWLPPKEWEKQVEEQLSTTLTFASGKDFDFFWAGEWPENTPIHDDDIQYGRNGFYNHMNTNYDHVFAITTVGGPYTVIPHFEILGK